MGVLTFIFQGFRKNKLMQDCLFLTLVVLTSIIFYIKELGFYSDDWAFLGNFFMSKNQSISGLFQSFYSPQTQMRPLQGLYDSLLYMLFGLHPLGYHSINAIVLILSGILFYAVLRYLKLPRIISLAIPMIYMLLPNYSTDRFWYAAFQSNLSICLYLFSLLAGLHSLYAHSIRSWTWRMLSVFGLILSTLSYEVAIPLFLFNVLLFWNPKAAFYHRLSGRQPPRNNRLLLILTTFLTLIAIVVFKEMTTIRMENSPFKNLIHYPGYIVFIITSSISVNFIDLGLKLPYILWRILFTFPNPIIFIVGILVGTFIFYYLYSLSSWSNTKISSKSYMLRLTFVGLSVFFLGYAVFFINNNINFTPTGIGNRIAIAASMGIAISLVGIFGVVSNFFTSEKLSKLFFCICIATTCTVGFLINNTLALFWISAYHQEHMILLKIHREFPTFANDSAIILDGFCPYIGPAVVFESSWDLKGALKLMYNNPTLRADVVTPRLKLGNNGLETQIYDQNSYYPYKNLYIYNYKYNLVYPLTNAQSSRAYFQKYNRDFSNGCPHGSEGYGVTVF